MRDANDVRRLYLRLSRAFSDVAELAEHTAERQTSRGRDEAAKVERQHAAQAHSAASRARTLASRPG